MNNPATQARWMQRPVIMGIVNVTPDSFSDGGRYLDTEAALLHGRELFAQGASIVDVGGESTRPGAHMVTEDEELRRVLPVVEGLAECGTVSIDTRKARVARLAVQAGATIVNDVSASLGEVAAELGVGWVAMHAQGDPETMQRAPKYIDVVDEVYRFLEDRLVEAERLGLRELYLDPGIGFGKTAEHNLMLLGNLSRFVGLGAPILIGVSRKSFLANLGRLGPIAKPSEREEQTLAANIWAIAQGARVVRVHEVAPLAEYLGLIEAMETARSTECPI
ncbi:dihydropteroate synthase [Ferrimicrobium sp.]|uniref:dihydropteroate synthase n=1 Tax=Ferrimicrobium sp. TaxID=2926050 RepID=UPI00262BED13|nr:dihydropteroate synthase [Ferrimicrobium sp.]